MSSDDDHGDGWGTGPGPDVSSTPTSKKSRRRPPARPLPPLQPLPKAEPPRRWDYHLLPPPDLNEELGVWVAVTGDDLPHPVRIRLARGTGGRFIINGLVVGNETETRVSSDTLRRIPLTEIVRDLFAEFDPSNAPEFDRSKIGHPDQLIEIEDAVWPWVLFSQLVEDAAPLTAAAGRERDEFVEFAEVYLRELARDSFRAMSNTARALHISRSTANRRAAKCRKLGLLPPREADK